MRSTESQLRLLIRESILLEVGSPASKVAALPNGTKATVTKSSDMSNFEVVLTDPGGSQLGFLIGARVDDCRVSGGVPYYVVNVEGQGYGAILYDIAMELASIHGAGLTADKSSSTSIDAVNVWKVYSERPDVKVIEVPDDCPKSTIRSPKVPGGSSSDPKVVPDVVFLNRVYRKDKRDVMQALQKSGMLVMKRD